VAEKPYWDITDLEVEISNQCGRLVACAVIYYSASIQSYLYETTTNKKYMKIIAGTSPVARQHINFTGHFTFFSNKKPINLKNIVENIEF
jgi:hypothetical protein